MLEPEYAWSLTDHVCGECLARVLEREADGQRIYRCSNCGLKAEGRPDLAHPPICACSARLGTRDAFLRCVVNPNPRPELNSEIVVCEAAA